MRQCLGPLFLTFLFGPLALWLALNGLGLAGFTSVPTQLREVHGVIVSVWADCCHRANCNGSLVAVNFLIRGSDSGGQFSYPADLPNPYDLLASMQPGTPARVLYTGTDANSPTLWGLTLNGRSIVEPADVYRIRHHPVLDLIGSVCFSLVLAGVWSKHAKTDPD